ncbi:endophilin-B1 isoform X1 [Agrilus planipennis]|uniref:Endophilin-B1 isoform X1 n=1 Tax=Agrilus planipennis TaxID=224129 RepID=A0A1W4WPI3_AGRPL|nr:endophilin-B1 isoform X1 [Agrilus planipennis]
MDFNVNKIVKDAGAAFSRVVQYAEEKLGTSERTELDGHFENLWNRANTTKNCTEKILRDVESVLIPNPGYRIEDYMFEKIEKKRPTRLSNIEHLGLDMIEFGNEIGPGTSYGSALIKVGQCEQKLGQVERDFIASTGTCFTQPLKKFLEGEMKTILKEKNLLETKRLDLDACKNRVRKARSMLGTQNAERDLRIVQSEFDRQTEITKLLLEGISSSHNTHLRCLYEFVETQANYYAQCTSIMTSLQKELASLSLRTGVPSYQPPQFVIQEETPPADDNFKQARVLYDYDAKDDSELNLLTNEVILVQEIPNKPNDDYFMGKRGLQSGKVPKAFLEIIS